MACVVRCQEADGSGDVFGSCQLSEWSLLRDRLGELSGRIERLEEGGVRRARCDAIDPDLSPSRFPSQCLGESDYATFGPRVDDLTGRPDPTRIVEAVRRILSY